MNTAAKTQSFLALSLASPAVAVEKRGSGVIFMRSTLPLGDHPASIGAILNRRAALHPERPFLAERDADGAWCNLAYGEAEARSARVAQGLLDLGLDAATPVASLSDASINLAVLKLGAMRAGIPIVPVSPAYSLLSQTFDKLRHIQALIRPRLYYASRMPSLPRPSRRLSGRAFTWSRTTRRPAPARSASPISRAGRRAMGRPRPRRRSDRTRWPSS